MMDVVKNIIVPAKDISFVTPYDARIALNLVTTSDPTLDDMIELLVRWSSDEISTQCSRSFAKETLIETFRDINWVCPRLFLSHWPIVEITSVVENGTALVEDVDYTVDFDDGKLVRLGSSSTSWIEPVEVTYTGGYELPFETPPALQQAAILLVREAYYAAKRGDATIKMVAHKEARVIYFDPNALALKAGSGASASPARRAIGDLLQCFMRFEV